MMRLLPLIALYGCSAMLPGVCYADSDLDALQLADNTVTPTAQPRDWHAFTEVTRQGAGSPAASRLALDVRWEQRLGPAWRAIFASRADTLSQPLGQQPHTTQTLKEIYLSHTWSTNTVWDIGRINLRQGVALGFNPTDFFRQGAVRTYLSADPASLRENRQGSVMWRAQHVWDSGALMLALAPQLGTRQPRPHGWDPDWSATNERARMLLAYTQHISDRINPQWLVLTEQDRKPRMGFNLSTLLGESTTAYAEWAGGIQTLQGDQLAAVQHATPSWRNQWAIGITHTPLPKWTLSAELHYNGTGMNARTWQAFQGAGAQAYSAYRLRALDEQQPTTRKALFLHTTWSDAMLPQLQLSAMAWLDTSDHSNRLWLQVRYPIEAYEISLRLQRSHGAPLSQYGWTASAPRWELGLRRYF